MESKLLPLHVEVPAEVAPVGPAGDADKTVLAEMQRVIETDCRLQPAKYLEGVRIAANGE
jgi:hypothetical protein